MIGARANQPENGRNRVIQALKPTSFGHLLRTGPTPYYEAMPHWSDVNGTKSARPAAFNR